MVAISYRKYLPSRKCIIKSNLGLSSSDSSPVQIIFSFFFLTRFARQDNKSNIIVLNLAVADILFLLHLPIKILKIYRINGDWTLGRFLCYSYTSIKIIFMIGTNLQRSSLMICTLITCQI